MASDVNVTTTLAATNENTQVMKLFDESDTILLEFLAAIVSQSLKPHASLAQAVFGLRVIIGAQIPSDNRESVL